MKPRLAPRHVAIGVVLVGLGWLLNSASQAYQRNARTSACQTDLKLIGIATIQYVRDYDEHFPIASNWADTLEPYSFAIGSTDREAKFQQRFRCPTSKSYYAFNKFCSGKSSDLKNPDMVPLVFDVSWGTRNFSDDGSLWPLDPPIHGTEKQGGNNVVFADGHVESMAVKPAFHPLTAPTPKPRAETKTRKKP